MDPSNNVFDSQYAYNQEAGYSDIEAAWNIYTDCNNGQVQNGSGGQMHDYGNGQDRGLHTSMEPPSQALEIEILGHPLYPKLVDAIFSCRKIGESSQRCQELEQHRRQAHENVALLRHHLGCSACIPVDPELDQFMHQYLQLLEVFRGDLQCTFQEADQACREFEKQISQVLGADGLAEIGDREALPPGGESSEALRSALKRKYAEKIKQLNEEFAKKPKKGKLPPEAVESLRQWWNNNLTWPYPTDDVKEDLMKKTNLEESQINNWFINQRKRHWKKLFPGGLPTTPEESARRLRERGIILPGPGHNAPGGQHLEDPAASEDISQGQVHLVPSGSGYSPRSRMMASPFPQYAPSYPPQMVPHNVSPHPMQEGYHGQQQGPLHAHSGWPSPRNPQMMRGPYNVVSPPHLSTPQSHPHHHMTPQRQPPQLTHMTPAPPSLFTGWQDTPYGHKDSYPMDFNNHIPTEDFTPGGPMLSGGHYHQEVAYASPGAHQDVHTPYWPPGCY